MHARFLGHGAVLLTAEEGTDLLIDPFNPGGFGGKMAYRPIDHRADAVVCTHEHLDHSAVGDLPNEPERLSGENESFGPFEVRRLRAAHDEYGGRRRGGNVDILRIDLEGLRVVHLSDVGHSPRPDLIEAIGRPDMVFLPVGGYFTIGACQGFEWWRRLAPRWVVPVHYRNRSCRLPLAERRVFESYLRTPAIARGSHVELESDMITFDKSVVLLNPACEAVPDGPA